MNANRRKEIKKLSSQLEDLKMSIESIKDEEQEHLDTMPDSLKEGDKGQSAENAINALTTAMDDVDAVVTQLEEAVQS
jgi:ribosome recycling factor